MSDESVPQQDGIEDIVLDFIVEFVGRLDIVREAVFQLHPFLAWKVWKNKKPRTLQKRAKFMKKTKKMPYSAIWKKDWNYQVHGMGCKLTHILTGEPLEWDVDKMYSFDKYWFINWLQWRLLDGKEDETVAQMKEYVEITANNNLQLVVFSILDTLCHKRILENYYYNRYIIL